MATLRMLREGVREESGMVSQGPIATPPPGGTFPTDASGERGGAGDGPGRGGGGGGRGGSPPPPAPWAGPWCWGPPPGPAARGPEREGKYPKHGTRNPKQIPNRRRIRNPKLDIRNKFDKPTKARIRNASKRVSNIACSSFGFVSDFAFRGSHFSRDFGL